MTTGETTTYLAHHLKLAGRSDTLFSDDATALIHQVSRGRPRAVNNLAVQALVAAYAANKTILDESSARARLGPRSPKSRQTDNQTDSTTTNPADPRPTGLFLGRWPLSAKVTPPSSPDAAAYSGGGGLGRAGDQRRGATVGFGCGTRTAPASEWRRPVPPPRFAVATGRSPDQSHFVLAHEGHGLSAWSLPLPGVMSMPTAGLMPEVLAVRSGSRTCECTGAAGTGRGWGLSTGDLPFSRRGARVP